jgi:hypothetical protein
MESRGRPFTRRPGRPTPWMTRDISRNDSRTPLRFISERRGRRKAGWWTSRIKSYLLTTGALVISSPANAPAEKFRGKCDCQASAADMQRDGGGGHNVRNRTQRQ